MRQIFFALPYVCPREPARIADLIRAHGTLRKVAAGGVLKRGGDAGARFVKQRAAFLLSKRTMLTEAELLDFDDELIPVSYTHLTLPTKA